MAGRNRRRLGVALVLDRPAADELDGLRRAAGDPSLGRIPPHLTLVPPVNVPGADLGAAVDRLRAAATSAPRRLDLTLGAVSTFLPVNPVLYLAVGGDLGALRRLRDAVFVPPLERRLSWPWVPHVTLADGAAVEVIEAAMVAFRGYRALCRLERVVLLEEGPGRVWEPLADAALGPTAKVGTGGLPVELVRGRLVDPRLASPDPPAALLPPLVINAYREGQPVGWARLTVTAEGPKREALVVDGARHQGIGRHLAAHLSSEAARLYG